MNLAVGRLFDASSKVQVGTAFAVTERFALTAFHCIGDRFTGEVSLRRVNIAWGRGKTTQATVVDGDPLDDVAMLRMKTLIPDEITPIRLKPDVDEHTPFVAPGAPAQIPDVFTFTASGEITGPNAVLADGTPVIQLTCHEAAAGLSLQGLSGAPVLVGRPAKMAVGVIRWNPPRYDKPELASGAAVFATPSNRILDRWPNLISSRQELELTFKRLLNRTISRNESELRSDIQALLLLGGLGIFEHDLKPIAEKGLHNRWSLDIQIGSMIIDTRSDLRVSAVASASENHLDRCLREYSQQEYSRYVGVLTDGTEWRVYHCIGGKTKRVMAATLHLEPTTADVEELLSWLEALLATRRNIRPTPVEIARKLGSASPAYAVNFSELSEIYAYCRESSEVKIKRAMWAKLLTTASGINFDDDDSLFVDHTLLVVIAELIGHLAVGFHPDDPEVNASTIVSGALFENAQISGVVEADFFDWIAYVPGGERFVKDLAKRLTRFEWSQVEHDVMKVLYESIIPREIRHRLGEYYTPDWLAEYLITECVSNPVDERVLDASCGSGTFLFHAIRAYVCAAEAVGLADPDIVRQVVRRVIGFDVHPVAVTLARVTYLLGIGPDRLRAEDRPAFAVPVYLGDSLRWGEEETLWSDEDLKISTHLDPESFVSDPNLANRSEVATQLRFPDSLVADPAVFDRLVGLLADRATNRSRGSRVPSIDSVFEQFDIRDADDRKTLNQTFQLMCKLHDKESNHIWGYYVRNIARPASLARPGNQVDVLVGNPPWLAYRYMTEHQKPAFRAMNTERQLWVGKTVAPNQDLSALFVVRCVELYLRPGGRFGYVTPLGMQTRRQYEGFRTGHYPVHAETVTVAFDRPWDLHRVKPSFFPQSVGVVLGRRQGRGESAVSLDGVAEVWSGNFDTKRASRAEASGHISRAVGEVTSSSGHSPYASRFYEGATVVPRFLFLVDDWVGAPLGAGAGRRAVESRRSAREKKPWKDLDSLRGTVECEFVRPIYLGDSVMPFRPLEPLKAVVPWDGQELLGEGDGRIERYPGLAQWWRRAEAIWNEYRSSERLSLLRRLDYHRGLSQQFPAVAHRVVYAASGMYLAAAVVSDPTAIIEHKLYWGAAAEIDEARFLTAVLNSGAVTMAVRPLQARGEHNPRDFDKYVFHLPIPRYDSREVAHRELVSLAESAEHIASQVTLPEVRFESRRRIIRSALVEDGVTAEIDAIVKYLLAS